MAASKALIVAGPTCSGKSALALDLAERVGGTVINADALQVYRELRILTARPSEAEESRVPHRLYGIRPAGLAGDVAWWRGAALEAMAEAGAQGRLPILCGGSGMYLSALTQGLAPIPAADPEARVEARTLLAALGPAGLHTRLAEADPATAARLRPTDAQRIARAWEVWRSTGVGLSDWQASPGTPAPFEFTAILLYPERAELRAAIAARFEAMLKAGALEEVRALLALELPPSLPAMRAQGVRELAAHLRGEVALEAASRQSVVGTGQLAKRQMTWLRHHKLAAEHRTHMIYARCAGLAQLSEREQAEIVNFLECAC